MNKLLNIIQEQSLQINSLREDVFNMQKTVTEENSNSVWKVNKSIEEKLPRVIEETMLRHERQQNKVMENLLSM